MKKLAIYLAIFLLTINISLAQENYNEYENINLEFLLDNELSLSGEGSLKQLTATVLLNPIDDERQKIISSETHSTPTAEVSSNGELIFKWTTQSQTYNFGLSSDIQTTNVIYKVPEITFPYPELSNDYQIYLQSEEVIDITPEIVSQTSEIIGNEGNAYLAVNEIADWVYNNVEYDLNTLTAKASKKSSWVLENKIGVCDEIASLFISMVKSVGIPARFDGIV